MTLKESTMSVESQFVSAVTASVVSTEKWCVINELTPEDHAAKQEETAEEEQVFESSRSSSGSR
jgi:hypothetical protein